MILKIDQQLKFPELEYNTVEPKLLTTNIINFGPAYIKRSRISIFEVTDDYVKKVLYYMKLSFDVPMNQILASFNNNFNRRIKMEAEFSEQIKELELLGKHAGKIYLLNTY